MPPRLALIPLFILLAAPAVGQASLSTADKAAAFEAGGFKLVGGQWRGCGDPGTPTYGPGEIKLVRDLNGDGHPDAVIVEGSTFCFGSTETGYVVVSKQSDGKWRRITSGPGIPNFLPTKGVGNWPDVEVGGPGFCFPVERWNGREYAIHRYEYEGKRCQPQR